MASAAVVLDVGARFIGHASCGTPTSITTSQTRASGDAGCPVSSTTGTPRRFTAGRMASSSSVSPELESASTISPRASIPRSPWTPSAGCRKYAGVPVDASVAAILRPMRPDFPMPVTITRPVHRWRRCTAAGKRSSSFATRAAIAPASISSTRRAISRSRSSVTRALRPRARCRAAGRAVAAGRRCGACSDRPTAAARRPSCGPDPRASP